MSTMPYDTGSPDGQWDDDGYAVAPGPVSPPVAPGVSQSAAPPVAPAVALVVSPDENSGGSQGNDSPPLRVGRWTPADEDPPARPTGPGPGPGLRGLRAVVAGSELLGGGPGGLLAELADPHPETMRQHWQHVTGHPWRPRDQWAGAAFTAGHLAVTGPTKATGKSLTAAGTAIVAIGNALIFAGMRVDWAGDRFIRNVTPVVIAVTLIVIVLVFA